MNVVILCGGLGTRLSEETSLKPKPLVTIGGHPILWHIMNIYGAHGFNEFSLALGYKGETVKEYFLNYYSLDSDLSIDLKTGAVNHISQSKRDWKVTLVDTGMDSMTGGRLHRLESTLRPHGTFMLTYGDGVSDVDVNRLLAFHKAHGKLATVTTVRPPARFGGIVFDGDRIVEFKEKPQTGEGWINGGFFVFEPGVFDYLSGDQTVLEGSPLEALARNGQLMAFKHEGFWQCMDTLRDRQYLDHLWASGAAPWKKW
ncbi:MAG: glucose-1-phosphate cytidylyltransferase [Gammaproteobacteria bacterium]|nr:glucose-1-phosphate cytidylyltransferase [Gammaproteobacteria bacterium]